MNGGACRRDEEEEWVLAEEEEEEWVLAEEEEEWVLAEEEERVQARALLRVLV